MNSQTFCALAKYTFHQNSVEFLEFILSLEGVQMDKQKVDIIWNWPTPHWLKDIQAFLGFSNFYCRFIYGYSDLVLSLTRLTKKKISWNWSKDCQKAFETLKEAFIFALILAH